jgi:RNA polymerase sigma-70 factor (ECF subfamily)
MDEAFRIDAGLLTRIAQRDTQALDALYARHARQVFSLALAVLGDQTRAADLTQEVFLLVWRNAGAYRPTGSARSWLLRLTRNRAIDELRRAQRQAQHTAPLSSQVIETFSVPHEAIDPADRQVVRKAVAALPAAQREALLLAFFYGLSHQEIATQLQTPLGTIKARIRRALQVLRQQLQDKETDA